MRNILAFSFSLFLVSSAQACHPYVNKWSQGCAWHHIIHYHTAPKVDRDWYVEIIKAPDERDEAIQKLKEQLK